MSDTNNLDQMIAYYRARLISQYATKSKAQQSTAILVKQALVDGLAQAVQDGFNIDTAVGPQLDILGKYIGLPRNIGDPAPADYFGFVDFDLTGNDNGFGDYVSNQNPTVLFYDAAYYGQRNTNLSDDSYRFMMKLKIVLNSSDSTLYGIQKLLAALLPGLVTVVDNQDMTLSYTINVQAPVSTATLLAYLPKPMGVGISAALVANRVTSADDVRVTSDDDTRIVNV